MLKNTIYGLFAIILFIPSLSFAADHKVVIQVNSSTDLTHKMALLGAKNLKTQLGKDNVDVEIVAYGPGIKLLKANNWTSKRVKELQNTYGVKFSICEGTLKTMKKKYGKEPELVENVSKVKTGTLRIVQLQEQGYSYVRP